MSIPLATQHPYQLLFHAIVTCVHENGTVELSETYFYPTGGGQPHDTGVLLRGSETFIVTEVKKNDGAIIHTVDKTGLNVGDSVEARIDEDRRRAHRNIHTATHVLCAVLEHGEGTKITGGQLGAEKSRIDVDMQECTPEKLQKYIEQVNTHLREGLPVRRSIISRQELLARPEMIKLAIGFPEHVQEIHLVEIGNIDAQPCGGTHVNNTSECGQIRFLKAENRGKNNRRIYFALE